ncbi:endonuclease/exonuclease/phosphatase family protein [Nocardia callitridis]|uniref:Endonuclease/exonuclease/phosphatase domain-containing protein n=1 Tax=Nocardia callitridis TaxID=648753 RepID=A0ABP9K780_9NOCA
MITVATWNVLHRTHADNWYEDVAQRWPDEQARTAAITERIAQRTERVIALQEVSGDQLVSLRRAPLGRRMHTLRYPRVPTPRRVASSLREPDEYLVLLVDGLSREIAAEPFAHDPGKGALAVVTGELVVIATHLTGDRRRARQFTRLAELAAIEPDMPTVLLGDFNIDRPTVAANLGDRFTVAELPHDAVQTRPRDSGSKSRYIDHVVARGAKVSDAEVDDMGGISDHNLVHATITL